MVTARLAIGSVSTLAFGALLFGSAPYLLQRNAGVSHASPWGAVSALGVGQSVAQSEEERTQLLKLAALKSGASSEPSSPSPSLSAPSAVTADPQPVVQQPAAQMAPAATQPTVADQTAAAASEEASAVEQPQQVASAEAPAPADVAQDDGTPKSDRININTASASALDHLPGAGRIGHAIVSHRPYKSVKDLISRRVLRMSDFQKIQSRISID